MGSRYFLSWSLMARPQAQHSVALCKVIFLGSNPRSQSGYIPIAKAGWLMLAFSGLEYGIWAPHSALWPGCFKQVDTFGLHQEVNGGHLPTAIIRVLQKEKDGSLFIIHVIQQVLRMWKLHPSGYSPTFFL